MWLEEVDHNRRYIPTTVFFYASIMLTRAIARSRNISHSSVHYARRTCILTMYKKYKNCFQTTMHNGLNFVIIC
ncbi:unnamed protein product [Acanthoscelides obtectus]|uniref:Uncharacterized protein n=1 Tax=Acanthoscelides obtectus TaxID=200917 RepID=A0A9P0K183_ACAOB|nr:unnamed protein product [Acanthoscelides obtectus]CAK1627529.1 hypothetical protein AOBTE_LOCUS4644 [Acanthoscelides obtectus]